MSDQTTMMPDSVLDSVLSDRPLDVVDAVFLRRLPSDPMARATLSPSTEIEPAAPPAEEPAVTPPGSIAAHTDPIDVDHSLVEWLLDKVPEQWAALAVTVEQAVAGGLRVIAVAGGGGREGRTTLVAGLAATLAARGWRVIVAADPPEKADEMFVDSESDRQVVIVDAGVWFPPGPIRRDRLASLSVGCDAAILVRRATQPPSPAWAAAIEQAGCRVVGEVVTFEEHGYARH